MTRDRPSDESIVKKVTRGDTSSFKHIVKRYQDHIFGIGMRFFKNEEDCYDFVQDVFMKVYTNLGSYKGISPFRFWLAKTAYNHAINSIKARRDDVTIADKLPSKEPSPERHQIQEEIREVLLSAINDLPEQYRICLDFYFFLGLSYKEICDITGFPINTIKSNVFRAKQALRDVLRGSITEDYHEM